MTTKKTRMEELIKKRESEYVTRKMISTVIQCPYSTAKCKKYFEWYCNKRCNQTVKSTDCKNICKIETNELFTDTLFQRLRNEN